MFHQGSPIHFQPPRNEDREREGRERHRDRDRDRDRERYFFQRLGWAPALHWIVYIPCLPNSYDEARPPPHPAPRRWYLETGSLVGHSVSVRSGGCGPHVGITALTGRDHRWCSPPTTPTWSHRKKAAIFKPKRGPSPRTPPCWHPDLGLPSLQNCRK